MSSEKRTNKTPKQERKRRFLRFLAESGSVTHAARKAGVSTSTVYLLKARSREFSDAWDQAKDKAVEALEDEAHDRAFDRNDQRSAQLLMFLLKAHKPAKYRDNLPPKDSGRLDVSAAEVIALMKAAADQHESQADADPE